METRETTIVAQAASIVERLATAEGRRIVDEAEREVIAFRQELDKAVRLEPSILRARITR